MILLQKKCRGCSNRKRCQDDLASWFFFIIGLIAIVAIRIVVFLNAVDPMWGKIAWYVGVIGFLFFFLYKYRISKNRSKVIENHDLLRKMNDPRSLTSDDYDQMRIILCSLTSFKDKANFAFIFIVSALSLLWALYVDFIR
ncbi:MAG: hypothetical protein JW725_00560 [Candidatus Babeliaceae bacterium]|nr:hypothetical protein [Candidatus Babeliaceae bacterium]